VRQKGASGVRQRGLVRPKTEKRDKPGLGIREKKWPKPVHGFYGRTASFRFLAYFSNFSVFLENRTG
jgi:hypothetical protein